MTKRNMLLLRLLKTSTGALRRRQTTRNRLLVLLLSTATTELHSAHAAPSHRDEVLLW